MRVRRLSLIFVSFYLVFLGGSAYYALVFPVRVFHHLFMTGLAAGWLLNRLRSGRGFPNTPITGAIFGLVGIWWVTAITSPDMRMALEHLWFMLLHVLIFFALADLLQMGGQKRLMEALFLLAALVVLLSGLELGSWYFGWGVLPGTDIGWLDVIGPGAWLPLRLPRLALAMNISTLLAGFAAPLITVLVGWAISTRHRDYRPVLWTLAAALSVVLVLTFSRGGLLSVLVALAVFAALVIVDHQRLARRLPPRMLAAGGLVAVTAAFVGVGILLLSPSRSSGDAVRVDLLRGAAAITLDHPVAGVGVGVFGRAFREYRSPDLARDRMASAHNLYLNHLAETGLLGAGIAVLLAGLILRAWWHHWQACETAAERIRLAAVIAALIGAGVHSLVDVFTTTPVVFMLLALLAYSITPARQEILPQTAPWRQLPVLAALAMCIGYGVWFIQLDRAQAAYQRSLFTQDGPTADRLSSAYAAADLDPGLALYTLQIAALTAQQDAQENAAGEHSAALAAYDHALALEPTWDLGWINRAALAEQNGDLPAAIDALERAHAINPQTVAVLHLARLYEQTGTQSPAIVVAHYRAAMSLALSSENRLPLSAFWTQTPLRTEALEQFAERLAPDAQYRVWQVHDPQRLEALIPPSPTTAAEYWVLGEHTLTALADAERANAAFSEAIRLAPQIGDYYASRARATWQSDPPAARRDLDLATLLGTRDEYPNTIRAMLAREAGADDLADQLLANALPPRRAPQEFAAVLYGGRIATFDLLPQMRFPGPGRAAMQPWYTLSEAALAQGNRDRAIAILNAIVAYAPDEREAADLLAQISG